MNKQIRCYVALFISVFLCACSSRHVPAPVSSLNNNINDYPSRININGGKYTVQKGDTLYSIAFSAGKDFRELAKNNAIASPYIIAPNEILQPWLRSLPFARLESERVKILWNE